VRKVARRIRRLKIISNSVQWRTKEVVRARNADQARTVAGEFAILAQPTTLLKPLDVNEIQLTPRIVC
jgi:hypothetical protein